ncbi:hypothetical protein L211DRAFT_228446 [Terfezia boudieri ATCC MYA-4762]|uniref:Uncharacterized protein n=1 Tax=Terfezia boudieri ATCC MYA-4762 TaxID=1051890 RepID=A0A3N4LQT8_9PEZI|nr:hypothetical protein L211DRAFT_228446 [Terfezia boudieri ATCC MYA-4762]
MSYLTSLVTYLLGNWAASIAWVVLSTFKGIYRKYVNNSSDLQIDVYTFHSFGFHQFWLFRQLWLFHQFRTSRY